MSGKGGEGGEEGQCGRGGLRKEFSALYPGRGGRRSPRVLQVQLPLNLLAVILDGLDAQVQFGGDFLGLLPPPNQLEHLQFAVAQTFDRRFVDVGLPANLLLKHFGPERIAHVNVSAEHPTDGGRYFFQHRLFHQVARSAGPESDFRIDRLVVSADHQHRQTRMLRLDVAHQFQAAAVLERKVGDHQVGLQLLDGTQRFRGILLFTANDEVALTVDQLSNAETHHRVIVHQQDSLPVVFRPARFCPCHALSIR